MGLAPQRESDASRATRHEKLLYVNTIAHYHNGLVRQTSFAPRQSRDEMYIMNGAHGSANFPDGLRFVRPPVSYGMRWPAISTTAASSWTT
jgi:hypothetical protein